MQIVLGIAALMLASLPGGSLAAPTDPTAADTAQQAGPLVIHSDLVLGLTPAGPPPLCITGNRFAPGDQVVWRAKVVDAQTGQVVPDATATVRLADGTSLPMAYRPHPPGPNPTDEYWTAAWTVPADAPLDIVRYTIEATAGSRTARFEPFNIETTLLTIVPSR
jgi:hypothetical protein